MTRVRSSARGLLAAVALLVAPAPAAAAVAPYELTAGASTLSANTPSGTGTLALQVQTVAVVPDPDGVTIDPVLEFTPAAAGVLPPFCANDAGATKTTCTVPRPTITALAIGAPSLDSASAVVGDLLGLTLAFTGGGGADTLDLSGISFPSIPPFAAVPPTTATVTPGAGNDAITIDGELAGLTLNGTDAGDDRYAVLSAGTAGSLALGPGNDFATAVSPGLTLDGGPGNDTLTGAGALSGGDGNDLLKPLVATSTVNGNGDVDTLSFSRISSGLTITANGTSVDAGNGFNKTNVERVEGGTGDDTIRGSVGPEVLAGGDGNDTIQGRGGGDTLDGGSGDNTLSYEDAPGNVVVDLAAATADAGVQDRVTGFRRVRTGAGNDAVSGTSASEVFALGAGDDRVDAGDGADVVDAGPGDDVVRGGRGTDTLDGGSGHDTVTYSERGANEPLSITLATPGGDGFAGENDTLLGFEDVVGGASNDSIAGDAGPNVLDGGAGLNVLDGGAGDDVLIGGDARDVLTGGPGADRLLGNGDDDSINAFDGDPDVVDCGPSLDDDAQVDAVDVVLGCEFASRGDVPIPIDADGDGAVAGPDCNDADPAIHPGAIDVPNDRIDQDCDGFDKPLDVVRAGLNAKFDPPRRAGTRITRLIVTGLQGDAVVVASCKAKVKRRCPFRRATRRPRRAGAQIGFTSLLKRRVLAVGTTIELRITAPGVIGLVRRFTIRRGADPRDQRLCVLPGSSRARRCPPDAL